MHRKLKLNGMTLGLLAVTVLMVGLGCFIFTNFSRFTQLQAADGVEASGQDVTVEASSVEVKDSGAIPDDVKQKLIAGDTDGLKIVFLTFDDGPSDQTESLLNILDQYNVKATFFPNLHNEDTDGALFKEIVDHGHTLGNHTTSHDYALYNSPSSLMDSIQTLHNYQTQAIGKEPSKMFRFPGGSLTANKACINAVTAAGYNYVDWNVSSGDANPNGLTAQQTAQNILDGVHSHNVSVVLCHAEKKQTTMEALPNVIETLKSEGYSFYRMDDSLSIYPQQM